MANTTLNLRVNAQFDELAQLNAEAQRSRDKIAAMEQAAKILGKTVDNTDAAVEAHVKSLKTLQKNLDQNSAEYKRAQDELKRYQQNTKDAADSTEKFGGLLPNIGESLKGLAAGIAAAFTIDAILNFTQALVDQSLVIKNYAEGTGTSVENISRMATAAKKAGTDLNDLGDILKDINEKISILQRGDGGEQELNLVRGLKQVGVELQNVDGSYRDAYDVLVDYGRATQQLANDQELAKNATMVLENGNTQFLTSVQNLVEEQKKLPPLTKEQNDALVEFKKLQVDTTTLLEQQATRVLPPFLEKMSEYLQLLKDLNTEGGINVQTTGRLARLIFALTPGFQGINEAIRLMDEGLKRINNNVSNLGGRGGDPSKVSIPAGQDPITGRPIQVLQPLAIEEIDDTAAKKRQKQAEQAAQKRQQEAERLAKTQIQYERDIFNLREGYERDIAKLRLDTLKQVEQLESRLLEKKKSAEQQLADAVLGRKRSEEDLQLEMDRAAGKLTDKQYEEQKQALEFERKLQDIRFGGLKRQSEIQSQLQADMMEAAAIPVKFAEEEARIRLKSVEDQQRAAQRLTEQGGTSSVMSGKLMALNLSASQIRTLAEMGFTPATWNVYRQALANIESGGGNYRIIGGDQDLYDGAYQFGEAARIDAARRLGVGVPSRQAFRSDAQMQENFLIEFTRANYGYLQSRIQNQSRQRIQEILAYAHNQGAGNTLDYLRTGRVGSDAFGTRGTRYSEELRKLSGSTSTGVPVSLAPTGVSQFQQIFALAKNVAFKPFSGQESPLTGVAALSKPGFPTLTYPNFSSYMRPSVFGQDNIDISGLQNIATQTAQIQTEANLETQATQYNAALRERFALTNQTLSQARNIQIELVSQVAETRRLEELQRSMSPAAAQAVLNAEKQRDAARESVAELERAINSQISSNNLSGAAATAAKERLQVLKDEVIELEKMPGLVGQIVQAEEERKLQQQQIAELSTGIANTLGQGLRESLNLLVTGSEDWGQALESIVVRMLNQIIDQLLYITVIQPFVKGAGDFLSNMFGNIFGGGKGGAAGIVMDYAGFGGIAGQAFADGGIMTRDGAMQLKRYAYGGIANSPQLAMFGEGSQPEAYVPLPDGRSIPVTMRSSVNNSDNKTTINNISVTVSNDSSQTQGSDSRSRRLGEELALKIQQEIIKQQRPGGLLA